MCVVRARRLAWRPVRCIWLGSQAHRVFDQAYTWAEAPAPLKLAAKVLGQRLPSEAEQLLTDAGDPNVKDAASNHLCRHRWHQSRDLFVVILQQSYRGCSATIHLGAGYSNACAACSIHVSPDMSWRARVASYSGTWGPSAVAVWLLSDRRTFPARAQSIFFLFYWYCTVALHSRDMAIEDEDYQRCIVELIWCFVLCDPLFNLPICLF